MIEPKYRLIGPGQPVEYMNVCEPDAFNCAMPCTDVTLGIPHGVPIELALEWMVREVYGVGPRYRVIEMTDELIPKDVFFNDVVTGVVWSDKSKSMTRRSEEDFGDLTLALLNCYWRKREHNRGKSDEHYRRNAVLSQFVSGRTVIHDDADRYRRLTPNEMRGMARELEFLADAYEIIEAKKEKKNK